MISKRIHQLASYLPSWEIASLLIENPVDLSYLTGLTLSRGRLIVTSKEATLFVDGRYIDYAKEKSPVPVSLWESKTKFSLKGAVGFDSSWTTVLQLQGLQKEMPDLKLIPKEKPLQLQRLIKEKSELTLLRKAAEITWEGIEHIRALFKEGVSEQELATEYEYFVRKKGASKLSFDSIIAFGEESAHPHHRSSLKRLKRNQIVLVDVGVVYQGYCGDCTRVFFFGEADPRLKKMDDLAKQAAAAAKESARPGAPLGSLDRAARDLFAQEGVEELFNHNLGHGVGLDVHEYPSLKWDGADKDLLLSKNMVFTIEPGLYRAGLGGVRYENTGVVTDRGFESFYPE
jgi:Xaa-Pro aminopeptidase